MTVQSIVVGVSGNEREATKIAIACDYAKQWQAKICFLHVNDPKAGSLDLAFVDHGIAFTDEILERYIAQRVGDSLPDRTEYRCVSGDWVEVLTQTTRDYDLLILGHQHLNWLQSLLANSLDEIVVNRADCPVLVVPDKLEA